MSDRVTPFLMFTGAAQEAIGFYVSLLPGSEIVEMRLYGPEEPGREGTVARAVFTLGGQRVMAIDSPAVHEFSFTPASSFFIECADEGEQERLFENLSEGGKVLMPLDGYGFSKRFGWVEDRFGISWQLNLA